MTSSLFWGMNWYFFTDVSGKPIGPIVKGQAVREKWTSLRCVISQKSEDVVASYSISDLIATWVSVEVLLSSYVLVWSDTHFPPSMPPHVLSDFVVSRPRLWLKCNRLLRLGRPVGAVTLSRWELWWDERWIWGARGGLNLLKPNDIYICRTATLTSRRYILNIYSTNIHTEYFKHAA